MEFKAEDEIHAPKDFAFARFTNFFRYEPTAKNYGADLRRVDGFTEIAKGVTWRGTVPIRGTTRGVESTVTEYDPSDFAQMQATVGGMSATIDFRFEEIAPELTKLTVLAKLKANTLAARLIVQSLKLGRKQLEARIASKVVALGSEFEDEYRRSRG